MDDASSWVQFARDGRVASWRQGTPTVSVR